MEELAAEREPLEARKAALTARVASTFREFNEELDYRRALEAEAGHSERRFRAVGREVEELAALQSAL